MSSAEMLDAALRYAAMGFPVFPCRPGAKVPATPHGCRDATRDVTRIRQWWTAAPTMNVAIATSGVAVIDLDPDGRDADHDELLIRLLADLRTVFDADGRDSIPTTELLDALCRIEDAPWATLSTGRPVTPHKLGRLLGGLPAFVATDDLGLGPRPWSDRGCKRRCTASRTPRCSSNFTSSATNPSSPASCTRSRGAATASAL